MELTEIQEIIRMFIKRKDLNSKVEIRILDLISEVGELSKEVLKGSNYGTKELNLSEDWENEMGDVLFSLICIANETNVNLEDSFLKVLDKYEKRFKLKGDISSD